MNRKYVNRKYDAIVLLLSICLLAGCKQSASNGTPSPSKVKVRVENVCPSSVNVSPEYSGTVEEANGTTLSFASGGTVKQILVSSGQMVTKGMLLAEVDETTFKQSHEVTLAARAQAEDAYARMKQLHDNNSLPEMQWIEVQSKLRQAVASEQIAQKNLADCKLYAPYSGFISDKVAEIGQQVLPGTPVLKLVKIEQVKVKMSIPETEIADVKKGDETLIHVSALGNKTFSGRIVDRGVSADPLSRSYEVKVLVDNPKRELLPGMICSVELSNVTETTAIILPAQVVQIDYDNHSFVWVYSQGRAQKRMVQTGSVSQRGILITSGLQNGEAVIVEGQQKISENMAVEPIR